MPENRPRTTYRDLEFKLQVKPVNFGKNWTYCGAGRGGKQS